jgi:hypothetical protein
LISRPVSDVRGLSDLRQSWFRGSENSPRFKWNFVKRRKSHHWRSSLSGAMLGGLINIALGYDLVRPHNSFLCVSLDDCRNRGSRISRQSSWRGDRDRGINPIRVDNVGPANSGQVVWSGAGFTLVLGCRWVRGRGDYRCGVVARANRSARLHFAGDIRDCGNSFLWSGSRVSFLAIFLDWTGYVSSPDIGHSAPT